MASDLLIRPMTPADVDAVIAMERQVAEAPHWAREEYLGCVGAGSGLLRFGLVAEHQGSLAGFAVVRVVPPMAELESIVVDAGHRRLGIGAALMEAVIGGARLAGANVLGLELRQSNQTARALYEHAGLRVDGRRRSYYSDPIEDAVLMSCGLR